MDYFTVKDNQLVPANPDIGNKVIAKKSDPVLIVQKPCKRTVYIIDGYGEPHIYNMPFPYVVFVLNNFTYPVLRVVLCLEPPTPESNVYAVPLGNIYTSYHTLESSYGDANVCINGCAAPLTPDNLIEYFWNSGFEIGWNTCANKIMKDGYEGWSRIPMEDVLNPKHWTENPNNEKFTFKLNKLQDFNLIFRL